MSWSAPKTDWAVRPLLNGRYNGDWFNVADYGRLCDNLSYLAEYAGNVLGITIELEEMPQRSFGEYPMASDFNTIESNLLSVVNASSLVPPGYYSKTTWVENGAFLTFEDLNRIESATAWLLEAMQARATYQAFIPSGSTALIDADGDNFMVVEV